jgi:hypothetical protein
VLENLALRQQLAVLYRATPRPRLCPLDRAFWAALSQSRSRWADTLVIVKRHRRRLAPSRIRSLLGLELETPRPPTARH